MAALNGVPTLRQTRTFGPSKWEVLAAYKCDNCDRILVARAEFDERPNTHNEALSWLDQDEYDVDWYPRAGEGKAFPDVPDHIAAAASEAYKCLSIQAYRAAVAMSRAVVEATAKEKGITSGVLHAKIQKMVEEDYLRPGTGAMAHEIRHWGNGSAHGDFTEPIAGEEAEAILGLMDEVLHEVFQGPARLDRIRQARIAPANDPA
jgi:hypothetical protein